MAIPYGRQLPKIIAASPMKPRPPVWPSWNFRPTTRKAPASPASAPEIITAMYLYRNTLTPSDSAAYGASPTDRSRSPTWSATG